MKGILIMIVVYYHIIIKYPLIDVKAFYVPYFMAAFFFISGYLHKAQDSVLTTIYKKAKSLLIPLTLCAFPVVFIYGFFYIPRISICTLIAYSFNRIFILSDYWFLNCLFISHILLTIFVRLYERIHLAAVIPFLAAALGMMAFISENSDFRLFWDAHNAIILQPFMILGFLFARYRLVEKVCGNTKCLCIVCMYLIIVALAYEPARNIDIRLNNYGTPLYYLILATLGTFFVINLSKWLSHSHFLALLGKHTLIIYLTHYAIAKLLKTGLISLFRHCEIERSYTVLCAVDHIAYPTTLLLALGGSYLISHYCPWMLGRHSRLCAKH